MRLVVAWLTLLVGCTERTEIVVGVATDLKARGQVDLVHFVASRNGTPIVEHNWDLSDVPAGQYELPGSFGLYSPDGSEPSVELSVEGYLGTGLVSQRKSLVRLVGGQTLFMRLGLVSGCSQLNGPTCASNETCIEGVCRPINENAHRFPAFRKELVDHTNCDSGTHFIVSSSGLIMPSLGDQCGAGEYCQEGLCYKVLPGEDGGVGQGLWVEQSAPTTYVLSAMWGTADGQDVFAVGEGGTILHLSGGPITAASGWIDETLDHGYTLEGVWGTAADDVYAVGTGGVILHRSASGWAPETGPAVEKLNAVYGVDSQVFAVGRDQGMAVALMRTAGGWVRSAGVGGGPLKGVWASPSEIWAVGAASNIQIFDGMSWAVVPPPTELRPDLYAVSGKSSGDIWLAGADGLVIHAGGGAPLAVEDVGTTTDFFAVWAAGPDDVYVAGDYGTILHKSGGVWIQQASSTVQPLFALWGSPSGDLYAAGRDGVVLHNTGTSNPSGDMAVPPGDLAMPDLLEADLTPVVRVNLGHISADSGVYEDFIPDPVTISPGTTVIWSWPETDMGIMGNHMVISCQGDLGSASGCFGGGGAVADGRFCSGVAVENLGNCTNTAASPGPFTYSHKFAAPGVYDYACKQHSTSYGLGLPGLGEIIVK